MEKEKIILFQGDSVTDCDRNRLDASDLGEGYPARVAAGLTAMHPEYKATFVNRGISGNRIRDLLARYEEDILAVNPDFLSILVGINDTWRRYDENDPTSTQEFESTYRSLLTKVRQDLPQCRILIMEPFLLTSLPDRAAWREDLDPKIQSVRALAREYADFYLPLDGMFARKEIEEGRPQELAEDGVHPSAVGHSVIADEYLKVLMRYFEWTERGGR